MLRNSKMSMPISISTLLAEATKSDLGVAGGIAQYLLYICNEIKTMSYSLMDDKFFEDFKKAKKYLIADVCQASMVPKCVYRQLGDLALYIKLDVPDSDVTVPVNDRILDTWGITNDELFECALNNTRYRYPPVFLDLTGDDDDPVISSMNIEDFESVDVFLVTTYESEHSAVTIFYPGFLEYVCDHIDRFYVYVCSPGIVSIFPARTSNREKIYQTVSNIIENSDTFSATLFRYTSETGLIVDQDSF